MHNLFIACNQLELPISQKCQLFDALVSPILNYAAEVWGYHKGPDVEKIHNKFCRKILCVRKSTNISALYGELGRIPMYIQRKLIMLNYWTKLIASNRQSILFKTYNVLRTDVDEGLTYNNFNWAYYIKTMLEENGLLYTWHNQFEIDINYNIIKVKAV